MLYDSSKTPISYLAVKRWMGLKRGLGSDGAREDDGDLNRLQQTDSTLTLQCSIYDDSLDESMGDGKDEGVEESKECVEEEFESPPQKRARSAPLDDYVFVWE